MLPIALLILPVKPALRTVDERGKMANDWVESFYVEHCTYLPAMLGWFFFSALLSTYNKYVFGSGHMAFPYPLLLTSIHFAIQWWVSWLACALFPVNLGTERVKRMTWKEWLSISVPCGLVTALDVGLSNLSLVTITITFYTMVKSSTPIFVLGWAYLFGIERITWNLIGVILVIAAGEFLTVAGEVDFVLRGFILCLTASVLSGARWTLVQLKLQSLNPPLQSTIVTMRLMAPSMFVSMLFISLVIEQPWKMLQSSDENTHGLGSVVYLGMTGGILAIAMVLCEFYLILHASAIILMIGGVLKEMTTIVIGVTLFGDKLNAANIGGCSIVFLGVVLYKVVFHLEKQEQTDIAVHEKNMRENVGGKLIEDEIEFVPATNRELELIDRVSERNEQGHLMTAEEVDILDQGAYETPTQKTV